MPSRGLDGYVSSSCSRRCLGSARRSWSSGHCRRALASTSKHRAGTDSLDHPDACREVSRRSVALTAASRSLETMENIPQSHSSPRRFGLVMAVAGLAWFLNGPLARAQVDPLPSWNDGPAKRAILKFVVAPPPTRPGPASCPPTIGSRRSTTTARSGSSNRSILLLYRAHAQRNFFPRNYLRFLLFLSRSDHARIETTT